MRILGVLECLWGYCRGWNRGSEGRGKGVPTPHLLTAASPPLTHTIPHTAAPHRAQVTAFKCGACGTLTERRGPGCAAHVVSKVSATKRFWRCSCGARSATLGLFYPEHRCTKCARPAAAAPLPTPPRFFSRAPFLPLSVPPRPLPPHATHPSL